jgi:ubiquinone/menaquinone biosynthesis C-methylase UbiE
MHRARLPNADLRQGDIEALPYPDDRFNAISAFNSVQYAADPMHAPREIKRVAQCALDVYRKLAHTSCTTHSWTVACGQISPTPAGP